MELSKKTWCFKKKCKGSMHRSEGKKHPASSKIYYVYYRCERCGSDSKLHVKGLLSGRVEYTIRNNETEYLWSL